MAELVRAGKSQFVIATHSPVLLTFPDADIVSFDVAPLRSVRLQDTSHYQITRGILEDPQSYWRHLLKRTMIEPAVLGSRPCRTSALRSSAPTTRDS